MKIILGVLVALWATSALAQQQTFFGSRGEIAGTGQRSGNQTTVRDSRGNTVGRAVTDSGGQTTYFDDRGSVIGRSRR